MVEESNRHLNVARISGIEVFPGLIYPIEIIAEPGNHLEHAHLIGVRIVMEGPTPTNCTAPQLKSNRD